MGMSEAEMSEAKTWQGAREAACVATLAQFPVGAVWRYMGQLRHIRAVIDETQFVYRVWNKHRSAWVYGIDDWSLLWLDMQEQAAP